jgi:hypothetical protein
VKKLAEAPYVFVPFSKRAENPNPVKPTREEMTAYERELEDSLIVETAPVTVEESHSSDRDAGEEETVVHGQDHVYCMFIPAVM